MAIFPNVLPVDRSPLLGFGAFARADKVESTGGAVPAWAVKPVQRGEARGLAAGRPEQLAARGPDRNTTTTPAATRGFEVVEPRRSTVVVESLATAAEAKSAAFAQTDVVRGGHLQLTVAGSVFDVVLADGGSLADAADAIRASGAPVDAIVRDDDQGQRLELRNRETGHARGTAAGEALTIDEVSSGTKGRRLELAVTQEATNARFSVDGRTFERTSNTVDDLFRGTTVRLETLPSRGAVAAAALTSSLPTSQPDGVYEVKVDSIAAPAHASSATFASPRDRVGAGALHLSAEGRSWTIGVDDGSTLADVAGRIQRSGAPVDAAVERVEDGVGYRLRVTTRNKGFALGGVAGDALTIVDDTASAGTGAALGLRVVEPATNARLTVNGRPFESRDNVVRGAVPNLTLQLRQPTASAESIGQTAPPVRRSPVALGLADAEIARRLQDQVVALSGKRPDEAQAPGDEPDGAEPAAREDDEIHRSPLADVDVALALESELTPPALGSKTRARQARRERVMARYGRDPERAAG